MGGDSITETEYFEYLLDTYGKLVWSICYKTCSNPFDAEDLTQDVFLSAYRNLAHFDRTYEKAWICKIASRKCLDFLKSAGRRVLPTEDTYLENAGETPSVEDTYLEADTLNSLLAACNRLKPPYAQVARMHFYEERSAGEIAHMTGSNIKTVQTRIYRAKSMLKKLLQKERFPEAERRST
ncbi:MAG: sigma-70 family RNA polymerase sigma factor [Bacteroidales bacterium]|nr:sigma-70 family RNA polymerase sigma factor [Clostridium sp.]MCM1203507.1 sigma-70 family RNA polymerase sigma factor [Bacteroidales bacterium]